jgi:hypothetical protein
MRVLVCGGRVMRKWTGLAITAGLLGCISWIGETFLSTNLDAVIVGVAGGIGYLWGWRDAPRDLSDKQGGE